MSETSDNLKNLPEYQLIPLSEIEDDARKIAVVWVEELQDAGGIMLQQKHKLASDIMNYAKAYHQAQQKAHVMTLTDIEKGIHKLDVLDNIKTSATKALQLVFLADKFKKP
jgi:hypothetical protein